MGSLTLANSHLSPGELWQGIHQNYGRGVTRVSLTEALHREAPILNNGHIETWCLIYWQPPYMRPYPSSKQTLLQAPTHNHTLAHIHGVARSPLSIRDPEVPKTLRGPQTGANSPQWWGLKGLSTLHGHINYEPRVPVKGTPSPFWRGSSQPYGVM